MKNLFKVLTKLEELGTEVLSFEHFYPEDNEETSYTYFNFKKEEDALDFYEEVVILDFQAYYDNSRNSKQVRIEL